ncbi:MAG: hypothetical protein DRI57_30210, partial [Deltaproteobacteria bacterium]
MSELAKAIRIRTAAKKWLTRVSNDLDGLLSRRDCSTTALDAAIPDVKNRLDLLDSAQAEVELLVDDGDLDNCIDVACSYRQPIADILQRGHDKLRVLGQVNDAGSAPSQASSSYGGANLPKINLPEFNGNPTEWTSFWESFEAVIDSTDLPTIRKFTYLRSLLKGSAKTCIEGLSLTASQYQPAVDLLKNRFGRPERLTFAHIQGLLELPIPHDSSSGSLRRLLEKIQCHIRSLEVLGVTNQKYGVVLTPVILTRMSPDVTLEWARTGDKHEGDLEWLLDFLTREIERRERSETFQGTNRTASST